MLSKSLGLEGISATEEDFDLKSDTGASHVRLVDDNDAFASDDDGDCGGDDDRRRVDEILYDETVKKKIGILAIMVGADSSKPEDVLNQAIKVLEDLEREKMGYLKRAEDSKASM